MNLKDNQESKLLEREKIGDRLDIHKIWKLIVLGIPIFKTVWKPVAIVSIISATTTLVMIYPYLQQTDIFNARILGGEVLTELQTTFLFMDKEAATEAGWTAEARKSAFRKMAWFFLILVLAATPFGVAIWYWWVIIRQRMNQILRSEIYDRYQALSMRFHSDSRVGDSIYRIYQDSAMITTMFSILIFTPIPALWGFLRNIVLVTFWSPILALTMVLNWIPALFLARTYTTPLRIGFRKAREANSALTSTIQEIMSGIKVIKAYGGEDKEQARFENASSRAFEEAYAARFRFAVYKIYAHSISAVVVICGTGYGIKLTHDESPVYAVALFAFMMQFSVWNYGLFNYFRAVYAGGIGTPPALVGLWGMIQDIAVGLDRGYEVLNTAPDIKEAPDAKSMPRLQEKVAFRGVSFSYEADGPRTLRNIDIEAKVGSITAIVGPTGSGKSTLMSLLLRLYDVDGGHIEVDGVDIRKYKKDSLPDNIAISLQENLLFGNTIRENIRYAVPKASAMQVRYAAGVAKADEFIEKLPSGYDTQLGERGTKLSTGQRQRLSIARAVLKDTAILILDEPTAALDAETELAVLSNLAKWGRERVIFLITHRLSTIRRAHHVIFLQEGEILEQGTHDELMSREDGPYHKMVTAETGAF